jgi:hypothetical protein
MWGQSGSSPSPFCFAGGLLDILLGCLPAVVLSVFGCLRPDGMDGRCEGCEWWVLKKKCGIVHTAIQHHTKPGVCR